MRCKDLSPFPSLLLVVSVPFHFQFEKRSIMALIGSTAVWSLTDLFAAFIDSAVDDMMMSAGICKLSHLQIGYHELLLLPETVDSL